MRIIYLGVGFLALGLGCLGIALPVLPTTPFLLLSAFCFARSSQRWYNFLYENRVFGKYLRDYEKHEMSTANKIRTLLLMWAGMIFCMWLLDFHPHLTIFLTLVGCGVSIHLLCLRNPKNK